MRAMTDPFYQGGNKESKDNYGVRNGKSKYYYAVRLGNPVQSDLRPCYNLLRNFDANTHDDPEDGFQPGFTKKRLPTVIYNHTHTQTGALNVVTNNLIEICKFIAEKVYNFAT